MASTTFTNNVTLSDAGWFNDVDAAVYEGTLPSGVTALVATGSTTLAVYNTVATTVNAFGAATTLSIGAATGTLTVNNATLAAKAGAFSGLVTGQATGNYQFKTNATTAAIAFFSTSANAASRNFSVGQTDTFGALSVRIGTAINDDPVPDGSEIANFSSTGLAVTGAISGQMSGQTSAVRLGQISDSTSYGLLSFNGVFTDAGKAGIAGGGGADNLYIDVPTGAVTIFRVNATTVAAISSTGLAVTGTLSSSDDYTFTAAKGIRNSNNNAMLYDAGSNVTELGNGAGITKIYGAASATGITFVSYGAGTITSSAAGVLSSVSDETYKVKDGAPTDSVAKLMALSPGYYFWKDKSHSVGRELGFYAQNVHAAIGEEAAPTPLTGKPWGYYDRSVLAINVLATQNHESRLAALEAKLA